MRHWFKDQHFKSLLKNTGYLAVSKGVAGIAGLAVLAFAGRALGVLELGLLILIVSYAKAASGLSKFQSWQLVVRYSGQILANGDSARFKSGVGFALGLDLLSGFGGMILAIALVPLVGPWFGISSDYLVMAMLYCLILPMQGAATANGVLRALDRFDLISWQGTSYPIARAILCGVAWANGAGLETFLIIWFATDLGGDLFMWFLGLRELKRHNLLTGIRPALRPVDLPGAWNFAIHVNLNASLITAWGPLARLVIGGLVGPAGAAIYRIASAIADSAQKPSDLLAKTFYPEIVRMDLASKKPWKLMLRGTVLATAIGVLLVGILLIAGRPLVGLLFGAEFLPAYEVLLILIIAPLLGVISFPLPSMLLALDRPAGPVKARLLGAITYFALVAPLAWRFGVEGAAAAFVFGNVVLVAALVWQVRTEHRRVRGR
jgi:O-antigen/teichoic acid export membrane protein